MLPDVLARIGHHSPLLLGSGSPRRREILDQIGIPFVAFAPVADESPRAGEAVEQYLERVTLLKLAAVRAQAPEPLRRRAGAVLVGDTAVVCDGEVLGKPRDAGEAEHMIMRLAARAHSVLSRFAVGDASADAPPIHSQTVATRVVFRPVAPGEARAYAESGEGLDKAGAYAVQGLAARFVARIEGSYTGVVGLPACELIMALLAAELL